MNDTDPRKLALLAAALLVPATGCATEDELGLDTTTGGDDDEADIEFRTTPAVTSWSCGSQCGENDPEVNGYPVPDLDLAGTPNKAGVSFVALKNPLGEVHTLGTEGDEPVAIKAGSVVARGAALINWIIEVSIAGDIEQIKFISFAPKGAYPSWNGSNEMPVFGLAYYHKNEGWLNLCPEYVNNPGDARITVLAGERYDLDEKEVTADMPTWITLACNSQAAFKLKRLGYGPHGKRASGTAATVAQRQATLKMLTADYCGDGTPFTESGVKLGWRNAPGSVVMENPAEEVEALWDEDGALCLGDPRFAPPAAVHCALPACPAAIVNDGSWEWLTRDAVQ